MSTDFSLKNTPITSGHLRITAVFSDGSRKVLSDKKNQLVNGYLETVAELLAQKSGDPAELAVHSLWVEASDTDLSSGVSASDTGPEGTVVKRYVFDSSSDVDVNVGGVPGLVEFRAVLDKDEANGEKIRAACLFSRGDDDDPEVADDARLLARQIFGTIQKESDFALEFAWRIQTKIG